VLPFCSGVVPASYSAVRGSEAMSKPSPARGRLLFEGSISCLMCLDRYRQVCQGGIRLGSITNVSSPLRW